MSMKNMMSLFKYNLFIPENYDETKEYPLVLFIHDRGVLSKDVKTTLYQGDGAVIWATASDQLRHECFVLAPQYWHTMVNDESEAYKEMDATVNLLNDLLSKFNIDKNRLYTTGQSMGCMASIEMLIKYSNLFAGALLVAGQWSAEKMSTLINENMWVIVSEGDLKAFPGMNASMKALEEKGALVSRGVWDGTSPISDLTEEAKKMVKEGNHILYTALKKGTVVPDGIPDTGINNHMNTWRIVYRIQGVRDWLFEQVKG